MGETSSCKVWSYRGSRQLVVVFNFNLDDAERVERGAADRALFWIKERLGIGHDEPVCYESTVWVLRDRVVARHDIRPVALSTVIREEFADQSVCVQPLIVECDTDHAYNLAELR